MPRSHLEHILAQSESREHRAQPSDAPSDAAVNGPDVVKASAKPSSANKTAVFTFIPATVGRGWIRLSIPKSQPARRGLQLQWIAPQYSNRGPRSRVRRGNAVSVAACALRGRGV
jgi:hypothetical protein